MKTAFEILQNHHEGLKRFKDGNIDSLAEYEEDRILSAMEEYATQSKPQVVPKIVTTSNYRKGETTMKLNVNGQKK